MTSFLVCTAAWLGGSVFAPGVSTDAGGPYHVRVQYVEVEGGRWSYRTPPECSVLPDETVRLQTRTSAAAKPTFAARRGADRPLQEECEPTADGGSTWCLRLGPVSDNAVTVNITLHLHESTRAIAGGLLNQGRGVTIEQRVPLGEPHRVVLRRDGDGLPTSWVQIEIGDRPAAVEEEQEMDLFYYEPF